MKSEFESINKILGLKLKLKRKELGFSQNQLGKEIGLSFQQIQKYEKGVNNISINNLYKISEILKTDISYFINCSLSEENIIINSMVKNNYGIKELVRLIEYYNKIEDKKMRDIILNLIKNLSKIKDI